MEIKNGLREIEKALVVINFPRFFESIPKRSDLLKLRRVKSIKNIDVTISKLPNILSEKEMKIFCVKKSGKIESVILNTGIINSDIKRVIINKNVG